VDTTFNNQVISGNTGGWFNGDFDYNGKVDGADYALIDGAFNSQGTVVLARSSSGGTLAGPASFATLVIPNQQAAVPFVPAYHELDRAAPISLAPQSVPDPAGLPVLIFLTTTLGQRRRKVGT